MDVTRVIWGIVAMFLGGQSWLNPNWNGYLFAASTDISSGDGHIIGAIFLSAAIVMFGTSGKRP